jgi:hypothetical protein
VAATDPQRSAYLQSRRGGPGRRPTRHPQVRSGR